MSLGKIALSLFIVVILSLLGNAFWLFEMNTILDWHSMGWLYVHLKTPYIITLLTVLAFVIPIHIAKPGITPLKSVTAVVALYISSSFIYYMGKSVCYSVYSVLAPLSFVIGFIILATLVIFSLLGFIYWFTTNRLLLPNKKKNILLLAVISLLAIPAAWATVYILPGFGYGNDWVDAVKMGYPVFWITLLLGIGSIIISRKAV